MGPLAVTLGLGTIQTTCERDPGWPQHDTRVRLRQQPQLVQEGLGFEDKRLGRSHMQKGKENKMPVFGSTRRLQKCAFVCLCVWRGKARCILTATQ